MNKISNKEFKQIYKQKHQGTDGKKPAILPPIKNYPSRQEWENVCWREILKSEELLKLLITSHERRDLIMRAAALESLVSGKSYRQIGEELWLSPQTISNIRKTINENNYRSYLERSKTERKKKKYSSNFSAVKSKPRGVPKRTKYGTIYMPY